MLRFETGAQGQASNLDTKPKIKGLDMVRRDWSLVSKKVSRQVLDVILRQDTHVDNTIGDLTWETCTACCAPFDTRWTTTRWSWPASSSPSG